MTPNELHELEGLLEKATPGPWEALYEAVGDEGDGVTDFGRITGYEPTGDFRSLGHPSHWRVDLTNSANAALIVAAVNALPSLLSDLREAREWASSAQQQIDDACAEAAKWKREAVSAEADLREARERIADYEAGLKGNVLMNRDRWLALKGDPDAIARIKELEGR